MSEENKPIEPPCGCPACDNELEDYDCRCLFVGGCSPDCAFNDKD